MSLGAGTRGEGAGAAGDEVAAIARAGEPDRYLAALLAPQPEREALLALAAFAAELGRIPFRAANEPIMGEIRLQWWREAMAAAAGGSAGHVVADAMRAAASRYRLPAALLDELIDARALELKAEPFDDDAAVDNFLARSEGVLFILASRVMAGLRGSGDAGTLEAGAEVEAACRAAGRAYGLARLLTGLPRSLSLGRIPLARTQIAGAGLSGPELLAGASGPRVAALIQAQAARIRGSLAEARRLARRLPQQGRGVFLPLALVEVYVRVLERQGGGALREEAQILPLTRVWRIAAAHLFGRL